MLDPYVTMLDIDVDQWRNAQSLLLHSARAQRRVIVLHDKGTVVKCRDTTGAAVVGGPSVVTDARACAQALYEANPGVDFVAVMERDAVDSFFAQAQDQWTLEQDLDDYVTGYFRLLDAPDCGIVTYPGKASENLGLQWRLGASHEAVVAGLAAVANPGGAVVLGVESEGVLWSSLIIDLGDDGKIVAVTTADPSLVDIHGDRAQLGGRLVEWQQGKGKRVECGLVFSLTAARAFLAGAIQDKANLLSAGLADGGIVDALAG
ncbi:MAG: hypothetical protein LBV00_12555 [Propionibacteriaceae bacterium]|jgi:hypothetical protein|nr:hypothetical protein [Propionibacteriaceae bacterium]